MVESKPSTNYERGAPENQTRITRKTGKTTTKKSRVSFLIPVNKGGGFVWGEARRKNAGIKKDSREQGGNSQP